MAQRHVILGASLAGATAAITPREERRSTPHAGSKPCSRRARLSVPLSEPGPATPVERIDPEEILTTKNARHEDTSEPSKVLM